MARAISKRHSAEIYYTVLRMSKIDVTHLTKEYKLKNHSVLAIDDISFSVNAGEFVVIRGESGSGKSTLLQIV